MRGSQALRSGPPWPRFSFRPPFSAVMKSLQSGPGALPPEPGVAAAMQHRQHDDAVLLGNGQVDDAVGEAANQGTARAAVAGGIRRRVGADALEGQPHFGQELTAQARLLGFVPAGRSVEVISGCWTESQHLAQSDCSMESSAASASTPGSPSARKLSSR